MGEERTRDDLIAHLQLAFALAQDGEFDRAESILENCIVADTTARPDVAFYKGLIKREMADTETAAVSLAQAQSGYEAAGDRYQAGIAASYRGRLATETRRFDQALEHHYSAFQHFMEAVDLVGVGNELARIGLLFRQMHRHQVAYDCFLQALEAHTEASHWPSVLVDQFNLVGAAQDWGQRALAQKHAESAYTLAQKLNDPLSLTRAKYLLAGLAADAGMHRDALELYNSAKQQAKSLREENLLADIILGMGLSHYALGELAASANALDNALNLYTQLEEIEGQAVALGNLGLVHLANGNLEKAAQCFQTAIRYQQMRMDNVEAAKQRGNFGLVLRAQGKWQEAETLHQQALEDLKRVGDIAGQATQQVNLASLAYLQGYLSKAEQEYQQALYLYEAIDHLQGQADVLANLGNVAHAQSQWEKGLNYYREALEHYRQFGHQRGEAGLLANIGVICRQLGRWLEAIKYYEQAILLYQESADRPGQAATFNNLALAQRLVGDTNQALQSLQKAQNLYADIGDTRGQAAILDNIGLLHQEAGAAVTAVEYHRKALNIYSGLKFRKGLMTSLGNLGRALTKQGKYEPAREHYKKALILARTLDDRDAEARLLVAYGDLYRDQKELIAAQTEYEAALALIEEQRLSLGFLLHRESFLGWERQSVYIRLIRLLVEQGAGKGAWQISEQSRGRTFLDQLSRNILTVPVGIDRNWWERMQSTWERLHSLTQEGFSGESPVTVTTRQRQEMLTEAKQRLKTILDSAPDSANHWVELLKGHPISYDDLQQCLILK